MKSQVEAYRPNDSACHGRFGITARTAPVVGSCVMLSELAKFEALRFERELKPVALCV
jgi:hypothetical protein